MHAKTLLLCCFLCCFVSISFAQDLSFNQDDDAYFQEQLPRYKKWLTHQGFSDLLSVRELKTDSNRVTLYLLTTTSDADEAHSAWQQLKEDYQEKTGGQLEARLFQRFCRLMEVPEEMAVIELYNIISYEQPCFIKSIYFNEQLEVGNIPCMNQIDSVRINNYELASLPKEKTGLAAGLSKKQRREKYLEKTIRTFLVQHFKQEAKATIAWRNPHDNLLKLEVTELRRTVLTDATNPLLAEVLTFFGYETSWVTREFLTIEIDYREEPKGILLIVEINGKYGSGYHVPRRSSYIDMEPEFTDYLLLYTEQLTQAIRYHLSQH